MLSVKTVSRGQQGASMVRGAAYRSGSRLRQYDREPGSAVASAAHLAGERLEDERGGIAHDYRGKAVEHAEVMLPADAPAWMADRERLWNAVEAAEKRCDARLGRELVVALPRELDDARNLELVRGFVRESLVERGIVADFAIHAPTASDGLKQPHAHILVNTRAIDPTWRAPQSVGQVRPRQHIRCWAGCRWQGLGTSARTGRAACRRGLGSGSAAAGGRPSSTTASAVS